MYFLWGMTWIFKYASKGYEHKWNMCLRERQKGRGERQETVRFEVLKATSMKTAIFWDLARSPVDTDQRFRGTYCLHHEGDEPPLKRRPISTGLHGVTSRKAAIFTHTFCDIMMYLDGFGTLDTGSSDRDGCLPTCGLPIRVQNASSSQRDATKHTDLPPRLTTVPRH
jgi:hypothetical protein